MEVAFHVLQAGMSPPHPTLTEGLFEGGGLNPGPTYFIGPFLAVQWPKRRPQAPPQLEPKSVSWGQAGEAEPGAWTTACDPVLWGGGRWPGSGCLGGTGGAGGTWE